MVRCVAERNDIISVSGVGAVIKKMLVRYAHICYCFNGERKVDGGYVVVRCGAVLMQDLPV